MGKFFLIILLACSWLEGPAQPKPSIYALRCEYLEKPIGIDAAHPRFTWKMNDARQGARQSAFALELATDSSFAATSVVWRSGKISRSSNLYAYSGPELRPFTRYFWRLQVWSGQGQALAPALSWFETGLRSSSNWKGAWISDGKSIDEKVAPLFRKTFRTGKQIRSARAYIAAAGLYELRINGEKIGDHLLDPMYTRFDRRTLYLSYDVTAHIHDGDNAVGVLLGNGWYNHQSTAVWYFHQAPWRARPAFCLDLRLEYADGSVEYVSSGKDWKTALSDIVFNSIYTAEHIDARRRIPGWDRPGFADSNWQQVTLRSAPSTQIVSQSMAPIRACDTLRTASFRQWGDTLFLYDMGKNMAGICQLIVEGKAGTVLRLKHAERLDSNGRADQSNIEVHYRPTDNTDPFQTDIFVLSGKGRDTFTPRFNYKGFQFVEVSSSEPVQLNRDNLQAFFLHSDVQPLGSFSCSNQLVNGIWKATNQSYLSNLFGYPTDCPQREKNGWTGDAHIAVETGLFNFDGITVYEKWLADHRDEQQPNGVLPSIIPTGGWGYEWGNGPDWTSTIAIIPWTIYRFYGDDRLLRDSYSAIKRYVDRITAISPTGLTTWGLGDWIPVHSVSPVELTSTAYYYTDVTILAKAARLFGDKEDAVAYERLAEKIKAAYNAKYFHAGTASYGSGFQTELSVSLVAGLVPDNYRSAVAATLASAVKANGIKLDVGLLGTKAILNALSENGYAGLAWQLASSENFPGWGYWIKNGATTLYENWPITAISDISLNHIMFGEIGAWLYKGLAGIRPLEETPGFAKFQLQPHFVKGLDSLQVSFDSPRGTIVSAWKKEKGWLQYSITIPANATAELLFDFPVEGKKKHALAAGIYRFRIPENSMTYDRDFPANN